jgi:uncharacterized membrane protein YgcG
MSNMFLVLMTGAVVIAAILLVRHFTRRHSVGYQRRFANGAPRIDASRHDEAFPFASTLYLGDGSSHSHAHHAADCGHTSDGGGGCSDGGGGGGN